VNVCLIMHITCSPVPANKEQQDPRSDHGEKRESGLISMRKSSNVIYSASRARARVCVGERERGRVRARGWTLFICNDREVVISRQRERNITADNKLGRLNDSRSGSISGVK